MLSKSKNIYISITWMPFKFGFFHLTNDASFRLIWNLNQQILTLLSVSKGNSQIDGNWCLETASLRHVKTCVQHNVLITVVYKLWSNFQLVMHIVQISRKRITLGWESRNQGYFRGGSFIIIIKVIGGIFFSARFLITNYFWFYRTETKASKKCNNWKDPNKQEYGIPLTIGTRSPSSSDKQSGIHSVESRIQDFLGLPYRIIIFFEETFSIYGEPNTIWQQN